jgi:hypothetical protein
MTFLIIALTLVFILYLIACYKTKSFKPNLGAGVWKGIILASLFALVSGFILNKAYAKDVEWSLINYTTVFAGIDSTKNISPMCKSSGSIDNKLTSNLGINQNIITINGVDVNLQYTHHSCAIGRDNKSYDAIGVKLEWTFGRKH